MSDKIEIGDVVIINDTDCPAGRLVAVVVKSEEDIVVARYLSKDVSSMDCCKSSYPRGVTKIASFGVRLIIENGMYWCERDESLPVTATYGDGKPRSWQESFPIKRAIKPKVFEHLKMRVEL